MASRENQGLQIALILFVMVTVVLGVTTYMYFRKSEEKIKEAAAARAETKQRQDMLLAMEFETQALKHILGYDTKTPEQLEEIKKTLAAKVELQNILNNFDQDMTRWGAGLTPEQKNYRALPESLVTTLAKLNTEVADKVVDMQALTKKHDKNLKAEAARTTQAEDRFAKQATDYAGRGRSSTTIAGGSPTKRASWRPWRPISSRRPPAWPPRARRRSRR